MLFFSGIPDGQQRTPGWSLPLFSMRSLYRASAHGWSGTSPGFRSAARFSRCLTTPTGIQNPERSGLPSGVRRVGAFISTLPSAVRGTFFHGYDGHWASAAEAAARIIREKSKARAVEVMALVMPAPLWWADSISALTSGAGHR